MSSMRSALLVATSSPRPLIAVTTSWHAMTATFTEGLHRDGIAAAASAIEVPGWVFFAERGRGETLEGAPSVERSRSRTPH